MVEDIRKKFYDELKTKLEAAGIKAIIKCGGPVNGEVIKLNGIALFKVLKIANPFKHRGVAIYRKLSDSAIQALRGKRAKGKNDWVGAPLTEENYDEMMKILFHIAVQSNRIRNAKMRTASERMAIENFAILESEKAAVTPKKKRI